MFWRFDLQSADPARSVALAGLVAALFIGCAGPTPNYPGPRKAPSEVAIISVDAGVKIITMDGRKVNGGTYEVLPGEHRVDVKVVWEETSGGMQGLRETCYANAKFIADPGQEYRIMRTSENGKHRNVAGAIQYQSDWGVFLQNLTTGDNLQEAMSEMSCGG